MTSLSSSDYVAIATALSAAALSIITFFYLLETQRLRKIAERPSFALEPSKFSLDTSFALIWLVNTGQAASDISVDCHWASGQHKFYVMSLGTHCRARLDGVPVQQIVRNHEILNIDVSCRTVSGRKFLATLTANFEHATKDGRTIAYQTSVAQTLSQDLDRIGDEIAKRKEEE